MELIFFHSKNIFRCTGNNTLSPSLLQLPSMQFRTGASVLKKSGIFYVNTDYFFLLSTFDLHF